MTTTEKAVTTDPLGDLDYYSRDMKRRHTAAWRDLYAAGGSSCEARSNADDVDNYVGETGDTWTCTRREHPSDWKHIATYDHRIGGYVIGYWGGAPDDPETEVDPEPEPFTLTIGTIYKFRNRPTMLMYIGSRPGDKCEVLDLTHERYRVLDAKQLIPRPDDSPALTPEQLKWVAKFMAERRDKVREVAIRQRADGYFKTADELNGVLNELGLEPHLPARAGQLQFPMRVRTKGISDSEAVRRLAVWANSLPPMPDGIELTRGVSRADLYLDLRDEGRR